MNDNVLHRGAILYMALHIKQLVTPFRQLCCSAAVEHVTVGLVDGSCRMWVVIVDREGLDKMRGVYEQNPKLGDAATLTKQLDENSRTLDQLRIEISKYEVCVS